MLTPAITSSSDGPTGSNAYQSGNDSEAGHALTFCIGQISISTSRFNVANLMQAPVPGVGWNDANQAAAVSQLGRYHSAIDRDATKARHITHLEVVITRIPREPEALT